MKRTKIRMYLVYWFENKYSHEEVVKFLSKNEFNNYKYEQLKNGDSGVKFFETEMRTLDIGNMVKEFLINSVPKIDKLNEFAERFSGFYVLEIVPEIYKNDIPAMTFEENFLDFIKKLKKLKMIDIDQYIYGI